MSDISNEAIFERWFGEEGGLRRVEAGEGVGRYCKDGGLMDGADWLDNISSVEGDFS